MTEKIETITDRPRHFPGKRLLKRRCRLPGAGGATGLQAATCLALASVVSAARAELPFRVRPDRPRVFVRADDWAGPSVPKLRRFYKLPEYGQRGIDALQPDGARNWALLHWLAYGDVEAGRIALEQLVKRKIGVGGSQSPSYTGRPAANTAAMYDWLRNHPDFTAEKRATVVAELERLGDYFHNYCSRASAPIFYARYPGAVSALGCIGLALHGDSPKAEKYLELAYSFIKEYGRARHYEDGASGGGNYSLYHAFPDFGRLVTAFESGTDANLLKFIEEKQGDWLRRQLHFQLWYTLPTGYFTKEGDCWRESDRQQFRMNIDILTHLLDDGFGRSRADEMFRRLGKTDYHSGYLFDFFVFNNPEVKPRPLAELGRAELFGRDSHGYAFFRSGWTTNDTVIFFKGGEGLDVHASRGVGGFDIWRRRSLAQRAGSWYNAATKAGGQSRDCNTMIFLTADDDSGGHPNTRMNDDIKMDFDAFLRLKKAKNIECGDIAAWEVAKDYARVKADLTAASKHVTKWTRELVFLGYEYLVVRDEVETVGDRKVQQQWRLHLCGDAKSDGASATTMLAGSKLFCRTLLPADPKIVAEAEGPDRLLRIVSPRSDDERRTTYLHVFWPTDEGVDTMPEASVKTDGGKMTVRVGVREYTFAE